MYGGYGRKGFKRKAGSYKGRQAIPFTKKRRSSNKGASFGGFLSSRHSKRLLPQASSWGTPGGQGNRATFSSITRGPSWLPERLRVPLKWTIQLTVGATAGVGSQVVIAANDITDPATSLGATQPYGYDVLKVAYSRFVVLGSAIQVAFLQSTGGTNTFFASLMKAVIFPSTLTTSMVSDYESAAQRPLAKDLIFRNDGYGYINGSVIMRNYCSSAKMFAVPPERIVMDGFFQGIVNATPPTNLWYWNVVLSPLDGSNSQNTTARITMIQYCEFYEPVELAST